MTCNESNKRYSRFFTSLHKIWCFSCKASLKFWSNLNQSIEVKSTAPTSYEMAFILSGTIQYFYKGKSLKKKKKASISQKDIQVEVHLLEIQINSNGEHNCKLSKQPSLNLKFRWHHFHWTGKSSNGSMGEILGNCPPHDRPTRAISYNRLFRISSTILG